MLLKRCITTPDVIAASPLKRTTPEEEWRTAHQAGFLPESVFRLYGQASYLSFGSAPPFLKDDENILFSYFGLVLRSVMEGLRDADEQLKAFRGAQEQTYDPGKKSAIDWFAGMRMSLGEMPLDLTPVKGHVLQLSNSALPRIQPLRLGRRVAAFNDPDWLYELKWDGFRSLAYIESGACRLISRKGNAFKSWPRLCESIAELDCESAILDGEIVCLDANGKADFNSLLFRRAEPVFYAFDCIWHDGHDLRSHTLIERKDILRRLLRDGRNSMLGPDLSRLAKAGQ